MALLAREVERPSTPADQIPKLHIVQGPDVPVPTVFEYDELIGG